MTLILCLDDHNGVSFNGRRQSSDKVLCGHMQEQADGRLLMNAYSAKLFSPDQITVTENPIDAAGENDCCFIENLAFMPYLEKSDKLMIYRWNRHYPSDVKFPDCELAAWKQIACERFAGSSHEIITLEVYVR